MPNECTKSPRIKPHVTGNKMSNDKLHIYGADLSQAILKLNRKKQQC